MRVSTTLAANCMREGGGVEADAVAAHRRVAIRGGGREVDVDVRFSARRCDD
jgi:protein-tyrosine phosphatase